MSTSSSEVALRLRESAIVPVVRTRTADDALEAAIALQEAGIGVAEITLSVPGALSVVQRLRSLPGLLVGAGTVLDAASASACIDAGAQFVVSPIFDEQVIACCRRRGVLAIAGALTPTEIARAWLAGAEIVKVFPCGAMGGARYLRAVRAVLPFIPLLPTGGVTLDTAGDLLRAGAHAIGVGSELVPSELSATGRHVLIEAARRFKGIATGVRAQGSTA